MPKILVFGGGSGLSQVISGLRPFSFSLKAVVGITDNGGSSRILFTNNNMIALGDFRKVASAFANNDGLEYRFQEGLLKNHPIGNLLLKVYLNCYGLKEGLVKYQQLVGLNQVIYPVSYYFQPLKLTHNNEMIEGEVMISKKVEKGDYINELSYVNEEVIPLILESNLIIIAPGSLYTSILSVLSFKEIKEVLKEKEVIYLMNLETDIETNNYEALDFIDVLFKHNIYFKKVLINIVDDKTNTKLVRLNNVYDKIDKNKITVITGNFSKIVKGKYVHDMEKVLTALGVI